MMTVKRLVSPAAVSSSQNTSDKLKDDVSGFNISGGEAFVVVSLVVGLLIVSIITTLTALFIIFKLQLFPDSELVTFDSKSNIIFRTNTDLNKIHLNKNIIKGVERMAGDLQFEVGSTKLSVNSEKIEVVAEEGLKIKSPKTGKTIFPPDFNSLILPSSLSSLTVEGGAKNVKRIRSPIDEELKIGSDASVHLRGNQGVKIDSKQINFTGKNVFVTSQNSSITFDSENGQIFWRAFSDPRKSGSKKESSELTIATQYKLCICSKSGRVFKLHMKTPETTCADVRFPESLNPCS